MKTHNRYRQLILLLIALILPSLAAVVLGWRTIVQERELSEKRRVETRQQAVTQIRKDLLARLERITFQEVSAAAQSEAEAYRDPAVAIVGWAEGDRLELPWDTDRRAEQFRRSTRAGPFAVKIEEAERAEKSEKRYDRAAQLYREALNLGGDRNQAVYAQFLLSGVLELSGKRD